MIIMLSTVQPENWTIENGGNSLKALIGLAITLALAYLVFKSIWSEAGNRSGDYKKNFSVVASVLVILSLLVIGSTIQVATGFGSAMLNIINSLFSFGN